MRVLLCTLFIELVSLAVCVCVRVGALYPFQVVWLLRSTPFVEKLR